MVAIKVINQEFFRGEKGYLFDHKIVLYRS